MKVIITGATGFVGEGVLLECLQNKSITEVLLINRRHYDLQHPKLREIIVTDFFQLDNFIDQLKNYDACFYCAGISSFRMNEKDYTFITYDTTLAFANSLLKANNDISFCFVSGSHTDSSGNGKIMWARVKGKTENALMQMPFKKQYNFRPAGMIPVEGQKNVKAIYKILVKTIQFFSPKSVSTLQQVGKVMINAATKGYSKKILEVEDINALANEI